MVWFNCLYLNEQLSHESYMVYTKLRAGAKDGDLACTVLVGMLPVAHAREV